ncbi:MAG: hypothetical protein ACP5U1_09810 [Desulfomonilaceae bacterium]
MVKFFTILLFHVLIGFFDFILDAPLAANAVDTHPDSSQLNSLKMTNRSALRKNTHLSNQPLAPNLRQNQRTSDETSSRRFSEPECYQVGDEKKCLYYEVVKIRNGIASEISGVLRCLFHNQCSSRFGEESEVLLDKGFIEILTGRYGHETERSSISVPPRIRRGRGKISKQKGIIRYFPAHNDEINEFANIESASPSKICADDVDHDLHHPWESIIWHDDQNSLIFIKDTRARINQIKKIIASLDKKAAQIRIESRIIRANKDWSRGIGILWGGRNNQFGGVKTDRYSYWGITGNQSGAPANTATGANLKQTIFDKGVQQVTNRTITSSEIPSRLAVNLPAAVANIGDVMGLGLQFGLLGNQYISELDMRIQIGEAQGQARTIARPNIQVSDGKTAVIKSGSVLNVQTSSPQWGTNAELVDVCLKLQVRPKLLSDGRIRMAIVVTDNEPNIMPTTGELYLEREAHTTLTVRDGETCVIGGIIRDTAMGRREGWPGLMNLPIIGMLFSNKTKAKEIDELLVFISPKIVFGSK